MREYLENYYKNYGYEQEDIDVLLATFDKIFQNEKAKEYFEEAVMLYEKSIDCDYGQIIDLADKAAKEAYVYEYTAEILVFMCLTKKLKEYYIEKGVDLSIYDNTVQDIRYQMNDCKATRNILGVIYIHWCIGFMKMERFAIGRFQYEIIKFGTNYSKDGKEINAQHKVLNLHIPGSGEPLNEELALKSFEMAKEFYKGLIDEPMAVKCSSWLLYPEHEQMLSHESNIYRFMQLFDIIDYGIKKNNGDLYRIFGTEEKRVEYLSENTSLQRAYKKHLLNGGKTGYGVGVRFL
ncbi:MAG: hypothetical protein E7565_05845 [Ruminococcaceae bacterium]|nr:hypothetical protein [Oscillospiraceae bacterium]